MLRKIGWVTIMCLVAGATHSNASLSKVQTGQASSGSGSTITVACHHENSIEDRLVLKFSGEPDCCYVPTRAVALNNNEPIVNESGKKQLEYFFKMSKPSHFEKIAKTATIVRDNYSVTMDYNKHKKGIDITVCFDDKKIGFQYDKFRAITGAPGISFAFIKRDSLLALNRSSDHIFNTAFCTKKKMM